MSRRYLTLMVIPHNEERVREFNISRPLLWGLSATLVLAFCALVFYMTGYYVKYNHEIRFSALRTENVELQDQLSRIHDRLRFLRRKINDLSETDRIMRAYASLSEPGADIRQVGVGGISEGAPPWENRVSFDTGRLLTQTYADLEQLVREARFVRASFDSIRSSLARNEQLRSHTPSISPVSPDAECWYSSPFGFRSDPFTGRRQFHNGVDIAGRTGTPILATADGVVEKSGKDKYLGYYVKLNHGFGLQTLYGHMRAQSRLKKGQKVKRGDPVGQMGKSGKATAPHLHYTVILKGRAMNPHNYIFDRSSLASIF